MRHSEFVCKDCFSDEGLTAFCSQYAQGAKCDFCGATSDEPIAAPIDDVIAHIKSCIHQRFDDPANAGLTYISAEGGWQGITYNTDEVFELLGLEFPNDDGRLYKTISRGLSVDLWCETDPYGLSPDDRLTFSWDRFCRVVKHERRYFFLREDEEIHLGYDELYSPAETLRTILRYAEEEGAFKSLPAATSLYRARHQPSGKKYDTAGSLGPPPLDHAIKTNRMSPPGVVMMYVAEDHETALAETANEPGVFAVGEFVAERDLLILDLTNLPAAPSPFAELPDSMEYDPRPSINFLHAVSGAISRPIARDDRVHVEYVPTQVVTEYVRTVARISGRKVDGVRYASSRQGVGDAMVIFADQSDLILVGNERPDFYNPDSRWLRLVGVDTVTVTAENIEKWSPDTTLVEFESR